MDITIVITSLIGILLLAIPGYLLKKFNMVGKDGLALLSNILLYVTTPMLIFVNFQKMPYEAGMWKNMGITFLLSLLAFIIVGAFCMIVVKPHKKGDYSKLFCFGITFANSGYMAVPFLEAIYPGDSLVIMYTAVFLAVFNILLWTLGVFYVTGEKKSISLKKAVINPACLALMVALPLFVLNVRVSDVSETIFTSLSYLSIMNTPVSMIVLGIKLADTSMLQILKTKSLYLITLFKLIIVPLAVYAVIILPFSGLVDPVILRMLLIVTMMPGAASVTVFMEKFGKDSVPSAQYFVLSTVLSVVTIPLMMYLVYTI